MTQATPVKRNVLISPRFRVGFDYTTEPRKKDINGNALSEENWVYGVDMAIFDPPEQMTPEDKARWDAWMADALRVKTAFFANGVPDTYRSPLNDGTEYNRTHGNKYPYLVGKKFVHMRSKGQKVGLCDANRQPILDRGKFYSGCYAIAEGSWYGYTTGAGGLNFGLDNVMKVADGEPLGRRKNAPEHAFREIDLGTDNSAEFADNSVAGPRPTADLI